MTEFQWPAGISGDRRHVIAMILWTLKQYGPIESESGRATSSLMAHLREAGVEISGGWLSKTLTDLEKNGVLGHFINRDINGKRTYGIELVRDPAKDPFPADPRIAVLDHVDDDIDDEDVEDPRLFEATAVVADEDEVGDIELIASVPGVALDVMPQPSRADKILYIVSLLNEILTDELTAPERNFEDQLGARLTAVNTLIEENQRLKQENDDLRSDKRKLAAALEQASTMMRDRAARADTNGQRATVPA